MDEKNYYLLTSGIVKEKAIEIFKQKVFDDKRFVSDIIEDHLGMEEKYFAYHFFDTDALNLKYLYVNKLDNSKVDSTVDVHYSLSDPFFILNNLSKHLPKTNQFDRSSLQLINEGDYDKRYQMVIKGVKDKALDIICTKHNIKPTKNNYIDVALIDGFDKFKVDTYYELVYIFRYRSNTQPNDYISIISSIDGSIYSFEYEKSKEYQEYLRKYRRPISYLPKAYLDIYYEESFQVYLDVMKKMDYQDTRSIYKKVKQNIKYEEYSAYKEYLDIGIFYFKILPYLKKYQLNKNDLKYKIYYSYLTLRYQQESGMFLYECCLLNLLDNNGIDAQINYLKHSWKLGELKAKKILYEHYNKPQYFDMIISKRYE